MIRCLVPGYPVSELATISLGCMSPRTSSGPTDPLSKSARPLLLPTKTWDCTGWGLPRSRIATEPWALLPPNFTIAGLTSQKIKIRRRLCHFCCTLRRLKDPLKTESTCHLFIESVSIAPVPCGRQALSATHTPEAGIQNPDSRPTPPQRTCWNLVSGVWPPEWCPDVPPHAAPLGSSAGRSPAHLCAAQYEGALAACQA